MRHVGEHEGLDCAVEAMQAGDEAAFRVVYRHVQPPLLRYLTVLVGPNLFQDDGDDDFFLRRRKKERRKKNKKSNLSRINLVPEFGLESVLHTVQ